MSSTCTLRDAARQRTAGSHLALEATPLMRAVAGGSPTDGQYRDYLATHLGLHAPLEAALRPWVSERWHAARLVKTQWLRGDLLALGGADHPLPQPLPDAAEIGSRAQAFGVLYVLEGATLGLQGVRRRIRTVGGGRGEASRFMQGYGAATAANWLEFIGQLETLPPALWPQALDAAGATFDAFHHRFAAFP